VPRYSIGDLEHLTIGYEGQRLPFSAIARRLGRARSAMHDGEGVLLLKGPGIRRGIKLPDAQLVDIAPTLLHAAGVAVPDGLDGAMLDVFKAIH
jgi:predicted AlkP superfamily phosphohydrolase/phosphomutase